MYDLIGDIHGHAEALKALLRKLGYSPESGVWRHPSRKVIFCGDYVDRGPAIPEVLRIVRNMVEADQAIALMGNHEYNALCFHLEHPNGGHLRRHSLKNLVQHYETIRQFHRYPAEFESYLAWFRTLPMYLDLGEIRVVHACWQPDLIAQLEATGANKNISDQFLIQASEKGSALKDAVETVLKGTEAKLPEGMIFADKDGTHRHEIRTCWWESPVGKTWRQLCVEPHISLADTPAEMPDIWHYDEAQPPVFFGHYWRKGIPTLIRDNVCCLDYSVVKGGHLAAYRWKGETRLVEKHLVWV